MKITISGTPGSGKSTVAKQVAAALKLKYYTIGNFMREMAAGKGMSLLELSKRAEKERWVDTELDDMEKRLAKESDFVMDSRLGFHFIPRSIKIFLKVSRGEAARRIFNERRGTEKENLTLDKTRKNLKRRQESERLRFMKYYSLDVNNEGNYDLVIDTTHLSARVAFEKIIRFVTNYKNQKIKSENGKKKKKRN